ncbi:hypothetical protein DWV16_11480 [Anaerotruncus sp. AF02-27]|uniref:hypothetical protein n=1 Tax=Anaerotruncus sp. AF02-27 TaxID=2292191 RepID=UPI000E4D152A|nr:hypothetical protein [Anaerotruncus sp. AF02-27]RGX54846.1 hypothetical protein DWV16_11480 [Anaerotruncus sp. AF02-27]
MAKGKAGNTKTEGGKSYVQTSSGLWVSADSDSGKKWSSSSSSKSSSSGNKSSSSKSSSSSSSKSSKPGVNPGQTKTERGKTYVQGANGGWYSMDDKYGQNVYNKYNSGSGSNKNGSTQRTQVAGAYTGNGKGGYDGYTTYKNSKGEWGTGKEGYEYTGARTGTGKDPVARLKNGAMVGLSYISRNPDKDYYSLDYVAPNTAKNRSQISDSAKAYVDWNYGTDFGNSDYRYPYGSDEYNWVYDNLVAGRGMSGGALPIDSPEYQAIWGSGSFNQAAYDSLLAQGRIAGKWDGSANGATNYPAGYDSKGKANPMTGYGDIMSQYRAALRETEEADADRLMAQTNQAIRQLEAQRGTLDSQYQDSAQQAYLAKELSRKNLPQQMAAMGLGGGASESANLALETNYGNSLNNLRGVYDQNLANLDMNIANTRGSGNLAVAQNASQYAQMMANALLQLQQQQAERDWQEQQSQRDFERQKELAAYNSSLKGSGSSGSSGGFTRQQLYNNYLDMYEQTGDERYLQAANDLLGLQTKEPFMTNLAGSGPIGGDYIYVPGAGMTSPQEILSGQQNGVFKKVNNNGNFAYELANKQGLYGPGY